MVQHIQYIMVGLADTYCWACSLQSDSSLNRSRQVLLFKCPCMDNPIHITIHYNTINCIHTTSIRPFVHPSIRPSVSPSVLSFVPLSLCPSVLRPFSLYSTMFQNILWMWYTNGRSISRTILRLLLCLCQVCASPSYYTYILYSVVQWGNYITVHAKQCMFMCENLLWREW